jgi:hypothetical protein
MEYISGNGAGQLRQQSSCPHHIIRNSEALKEQCQPSEQGHRYSANITVPPVPPVPATQNGGEPHLPVLAA